MTAWYTYTCDEVGLSFAAFADPDARTAVGIDASGLRFAQSLGPLALSVEWSDHATLDAWLEATRARNATFLSRGAGVLGESASVEVVEEGAEGHGIEPSEGAMRWTAWTQPHRGRSLLVTFQRPRDAGEDEEREFVGSVRLEDG
jgi:hypothetical protein